MRIDSPPYKAKTYYQQPFEDWFAQWSDIDKAKFAESTGLEIKSTRYKERAKEELVRLEQAAQIWHTAESYCWDFQRIYQLTEGWSSSLSEWQLMLWFQKKEITDPVKEAHIYLARIRSSHPFKEFLGALPTFEVLATAIKKKKEVEFGGFFFKSDSGFGDLGVSAEEEVYLFFLQLLARCFQDYYCFDDDVVREKMQRYGIFNRIAPSVSSKSAANRLLRTLKIDQIHDLDLLEKLKAIANGELPNFKISNDDPFQKNIGYCDFDSRLPSHDQRVELLAHECLSCGLEFKRNQVTTFPPDIFSKIVSFVAGLEQDPRVGHKILKRCVAKQRELDEYDDTQWESDRGSQEDEIYSNIDNITPEQYKAISRNSADKVAEGFADLIVAKIKRDKKPN